MILAREKSGKKTGACCARRGGQEIEAILGYLDEPELIHRDNLVLL